MDSIKEEKLQAMRSYKKAQFLNNLIFYSLTTLISCLFCSFPFWFPFMKHFLYVSLPNILSFFLNPKCVFLVGNIIVVVLVRELKLTSSNSSDATEIYDGYVERNRRLGGKSIELDEEKKELTEIIEDYKEEKEEVVKTIDDEEGDDDDDVEEVHGMAAEELNGRAEAFIARVNRQRWLDEKILLCSRG